MDILWKFMSLPTELTAINVSINTSYSHVQSLIMSVKVNSCPNHQTRESL